MSSTMRAIAVLGVLLILVGLVPFGALAQAPETAADPPTSGQRVDDAVAADGEQLAGDPLAAHAYLRERVAFEPYAGVLKGDRGTYLTAAGNGADQAMLLASLIRAGDPSAGLRFAICDLDGSILASLAAESRAADSMLLIDEADAIAAAIDDPELSQAILELADRRDTIRADAATAAGELEMALDGAGYPWDIAIESVGPVTSEHVWLQADVGGSWVDLDPTSESGAAPCQATGSFDRLPELMAHRIALSVVAEARSDGTMSEGELLRVEMPIHELSTARIALGFGEPTGWLEISSEPGFGLNPDPDAGLSPYTPVLRIDGESHVGTSIAFPAVGSFVADEVDDAVGGALDLFDTLPGEAEVATEKLVSNGITAIWLDLLLTRPGGETIDLRSEVLDRIGVAARADGTTATATLAPLAEAEGDYVALSTLWQIGLLVGPSRATAGALDGSLDPLTIDGLSGHLDALLRTFPALRADFGGNPGAPAIVLAGLVPGSDGDEAGASLLFDALYVPSERPSDTAEAARDAQATLAAEEMLIAFGGSEAAGSSGVTAVMQAASAAATPLVLLSPGDAPTVSRASPAALARMAARLENGTRLLVPGSAPIVHGVATTAWWSIDPVSGIVRDEHENGRHTAAETVEREVNTISFMGRLRKFGCTVARPAALAITILYIGTGAGASPLHEVLEEVVQAAEAEAERRAEREVAEKAACAGS